MPSHEAKNAALQSRRAVVLELLAGYLLIFAVVGLLFGLATGIGVRIPWAVIAAMAVLWLVLSVLAARGPGGIAADAATSGNCKSKGGNK